jgi:hypothetical protein
MDDNIISVNVPNAISVLVIGLVGLLLLSFVQKLRGKKKAMGVTTGAAFSGGG